MLAMSNWSSSVGILHVANVQATNARSPNLGRGENGGESIPKHSNLFYALLLPGLVRILDWIWSRI